jgi:acetyl-CoA carboxylase carboxyl transferase subunit alpha
LAEKFSLPIIIFVDTPGAYPGIGAEERGQANSIANNLRDMAQLRVPIVIFVIGEGGSGGALGVGLGDRIYSLENSYYSVISPEGCAAILWRDRADASKAAEALRLTSQDLFDMKLIDGIIKEPLGGAHKDPEGTADMVRERINIDLEELGKITPDELVEARYRKFRRIGKFIEPSGEV